MLIWLVMPLVEVKYMNIQLDIGAYMPDRAHVPDAGADLRTPVDFTLYGNSHKTIDTGVHIEIPYGYVGMVKSKSGLMVEGIVTDGTVDSGYTGSIRVVLFNHISTAGNLRPVRRSPSSLS